MTNNNEKQQLIQQRYMEFQSLQEEYKQINEQVERIAERIEEIGKIIEDIKEIAEINEDTEILVPVSNGIFIKANTTNNKEFLVNVGGKTIVKKNKEEVNQLLLKQKEELKEFLETTTNDLEIKEQQIKKIQSELQSIIG
jgi:prefoldin alpha subunit